MTNNKPTGYLLHENANYIVVATMATENVKTGNMVQVWILTRDVSPVQAVKDGTDDIVCFDCKHRGTPGGKNRTCYVTVFQAPNHVWKAYKRGRYPFLGTDDYAEVFKGRKIRFGAYGEPVLIPLHILRELAIASDGWTGYTHQWAQPEYQRYGVYIMASVDTVAEYQAAKALGWRTFRVRSHGTPMLEREIMCPASDEAEHKTTCADCRLCSGSYAGDPRKDVSIVIHGANAAKFIQIGA